MIEIRADFLANVWKILAQPGDEVEQGQVIAVLESMKMEIPIVAPVGGRVVEVSVAEGATVEEGEVLALLEPSDSATTSDAG